MILKMPRKNAYIPKIPAFLHHRCLAKYQSIVTNKLEIITPLNFQQTRNFTVVVFEEKSIIGLSSATVLSNTGSVL